tara:strand:+ start:165 stop:578 length:414 start_codon:yes stop_codon:yes gene_type:complete
MTDYSKAQEYRLRDIVRRYFPFIPGIERNPLSGAARLMKGDIADGKDMLPVHLDHKSTRGRNSITIHREDIEKTYEQGEGKPFKAMTFNFFKDDKVYAIVRVDDILRLIAYWFKAECMSMLMKRTGEVLDKWNKSSR